MKEVYAALGLLVAAFALVAAGCGGGGGGGRRGAVVVVVHRHRIRRRRRPRLHPGHGSSAPGLSRVQNTQIVAAVKYQLEQQNYKAGDYNIAFQSCDDATAQAGGWDSGKCSANANAYAANDGVIGVIGTFNSGCAAIEIPVLNQAPDGGIPMLSPANTYVCLTAAAPSCDSTEPDKYYPSGNRNYLRVVANDAYQGSADAEFAQSLGVKSVYILNDKQAYGLGVATNFRDAAQSLGIKIAGFAAWDSKASSYTSTFDKIKQTDADAVFLGGLTDENGGQLIKDKVAVLGPNNGAVKLFRAGRLHAAVHYRRGWLRLGRHVLVCCRTAHRQVPGQGQGVHRRTPQWAALGPGDRPLRNLRRPGCAGVPRCDRGVGRLALGCHLQAVRVRREDRPPGLVHVLRGRDRGEHGCDGRDHDLQGGRHAQDGHHDRSEADDSRRSAQANSTDVLRKSREGIALPRFAV